jgi:hypothetical protein
MRRLGGEVVEPQSGEETDDPMGDPFGNLGKSPMLAGTRIPEHVKPPTRFLKESLLYQKFETGTRETKGLQFARPVDRRFLE